MMMMHIHNFQNYSAKCIRKLCIYNYSKKIDSEPARGMHEGVLLLLSYSMLVMFGYGVHMKIKIESSRVVNMSILFEVLYREATQ